MRNTAGYYSLTPIKMVKTQTHADFDSTYLIIRDFLFLFQKYERDNFSQMDVDFLSLFGDDVTEDQLDLIGKLLSSYHYSTK